jgi:hypothetical protein
VDVATFEISDEQHRRAARRNGKHLVGEVAAGLIAGQVVDVFRRMQQQEIDPLIVHGQLDVRYTRFKFARRESLPTPWHCFFLIDCLASCRVGNDPCSLAGSDLDANGFFIL